MGQKYVTIDVDGTVLEPYDDVNNNVPNGAVAISNEDFELLSNKDYLFSDFQVVGGTFSLKLSASDNVKQRIVDKLDEPKALLALIELLIDEINILRTQHALPDRTLAQFKAAMKGKLT